MRTRIVRPLLVVVLALALCCLRSAELSAQLPGQFEGPGWLVGYGGGASPTGALGVTADRVSPPVALGAIEPFMDIAAIATSGHHTLIARRNGGLWTMGGSTGAPTQIHSLVDIYQVAAGGNASFALDTAGVLWVWHDEDAPVASTFSDVMAVDAGNTVAVAARWDGSVWTWNHVAGSAPVRVATPPDFFATDVAVGQSIALARSFHGEVVAWDPAVPASVEWIATGIASIAAGGNHFVLARTDGTALARGANDRGQLGNGSFEPASGLVTVAGLTNIVDVAAGASHSVAVAANGTVYAWGLNTSRQLLLPTVEDAVAVPTPIMDVPRTARYAVAAGDATILLNDPGSLAITHNIETYPFEFECGQPFDATLSLAGFDASGGQLNQAGPGLTSIAMTLNVTEAFERSGAVTATAGSVTTNGSQVTWTLPSLGASTATLHLRLYPNGPEGEFPVFDPFTYVSQEYSEPFAARYPVAFHRECASTGDQAPPIISAVTPSRSVLTPPNRQMVPVTILVEATDNVSTPVCSISGVTSNESINGDWLITAPLRLNLRAERAGQGNGRVYTIAVACADEAGNVATGSTTVLVPRGNQHP